MRDQRGVTMVELLVTVFLGAVIMLGVASFYWRATRAWVASNTQVAMQRQATLAQQELTRVVQASDGILGGTCGPVTALASLPVRVPVDALPETTVANGGQKHFCFYWAANPGCLVKCTFNPTVSTLCTAAGRNLLLGDPTPQNVQATAATFTVVNNAVVDVALTIQAADAANTILAGPLSLATRVSINN